MSVRANPRGVQVVSLLVLALQSASLTLLMKYSRGYGGGAEYNASAVVCVVEVAKLLLSFGLEALTGQRGSFRRTFAVITRDIMEHPGDFGRLALPAFLYAIQNNLCYVALRHLSALTYQVVYQMKILTTAGFSVWLLGKRLNHRHWAALSLLTCGVICVQLASTASGPSATTTGSSTWLGFAVLLFNSLSSGYAGVYFEQLSKAAAGIGVANTQRATRRSLWIQSVELGLFGLAFSLAVAHLGRDGPSLRANGYLHGFNAMTWALIGLMSLGGILVAFVIRFADNIQKAFATSLSIVICSLVSVGILGHSLPLNLAIGTGLVSIAVLLYARAEATKRVK